MPFLISSLLKLNLMAICLLIAIKCHHNDDSTVYEQTYCVNSFQIEQDLEGVYTGMIQRR